MKPGPVTLTAPEARAIALRAQGLAEEEFPFGRGRDGVLKAVEHLGYVQVDTISVIQRAHHHVLWSRVPDYHPGMLHSLQSDDAKVFEYWNHASSYLPTRDYKYSLPLMRRHRTRLHWSDDTPEMRKAMARMLAAIRRNGPLMISDVESAGKVREWAGQTTGKIERRALHELWMRGDIMIRSRKGFEKVFDLPENVLPGDTDRKHPSTAGTAEFHVRRGLRALGIAQAQELHYLHDAGQAGAVRKALLALVKRGEAVELRVEGLTKHALFALRESLELRHPLERDAIRFLSPFDNLTIQRKRMKWLFDFDYTVEIYVPAAKRKYGYFVLPVLWGDRIIARMDAKAVRGEKLLLIHNLILEPDFQDLDAVRLPLRKALDEFTRFQGCSDWKISRVVPDFAGPQLM